MVLFSFTSVATKENNFDTAIDIVMTEGMTISMVNPNCFSLSIKAGNNLVRHYTWNNGTRSATLRPRTSKWYGAYGAYLPDYEWKKHDGITRLVAEEAILNYPTYDQLLCATSSSQDECHKKYYKYKGNEPSLKNFDFVNTMSGALHSDTCRAYNDNGIFVSLKKVKGPGNGGTLSVTVYQLLVNSLPAKNLPGSANERVVVTIPNLK